MDNPWQNLGKANTHSPRVEAQKEWAKRRNEHLQNPNPGLWGNIIRKLGNIASNQALETAERRDLSWEHHPTDYIEGSRFSDSPIDTARFNVYNKMLQAAQQGQKPDPITNRQWQTILSGEIPKDAINP